MTSRWMYPLQGLAWLCLAAFNATAFAEWSDDAAANFIVADDAGGASQPHIVAAPDGGFYVSWNSSSSGGFDVRLQRLDADGNELWAHGGILVADRAYGFTYDYGLAVDAAGNAYVSFNCCVNNSLTEHIVVSKVTPSGSLAWGADGITVMTGSTEHVYNAFVTVATDGNAVVAWTSDSGARAQKLDPNGNILWAANGVLLTQPSGAKFVADIQPSQNGDVIVSWSNQSGSTRILRAQRLASANGAPQWGGGTAVQVFDQGNLQAGYFPKFIADGTGGGVFYDYDIIGTSGFNVRVQHIDASGTRLLDPNGVLATTDTVNKHLTPAASFDPATGNIYIVWRDTQQIGTALFDGVSAQRIDASGTRTWGDSGKVLVPLADSTDGINSITQLTAVPAGGDAILTWVTGTFPAPTEAITATRLDTTGAAVWPSSTAFVRSTGITSRTQAVLGAGGFAAYVFEDGDESTGTPKIEAQNLNFDGTLGVVASIPANDTWAGAIDIPTVTAGAPFATTETNPFLATVDATDPPSPCMTGAQSGTPGVGNNTLWYSYTTGNAPEYVNLGTQGTLYYNTFNTNNSTLSLTPATISVYTGQPGSFRLVAGGCNGTTAGYGSPSLIAGLRLEPNTTYSIEIAAVSLLWAGDPPSFAASAPALAFTMSAAPVYTVDRFDDVLPAATTCSAGNCSIRAAVNAANAAPGAIMLPAGTYAMTSTTTNDDANANGDFDVGNSTSIYGAGKGQTIIQAQPADRAFDFISPVQGNSGTGQTNRLEGVSLIGTGDPAVGGSGTFTFGGSLLRSRSTSFMNFTSLVGIEIANGYSTNLGDAGSFRGGGGAQIAAHGQIIDSDIHDNVGLNGGGIAVLTVAAPFEIRGSTFRNNVAKNAAASTGASAAGGGAMLLSSAAVIVDSTITNNHSYADGGGVSLGLIGAATQAKVQFINTTIAGNIADADADLIGTGGGINVARTAGINAYNNIVFGNAPSDCVGGTPAAASPTLTGYNAVGIVSGAACGFSAANNDLIGVDPMIGTLADNGGPTLTMAPFANSPMIDAGNPAGCRDSLGALLPTDQRGFPRTAGLRCDIGAVEISSSTMSAPDMPVLDPDSDSGVSNTDDITNVTSPTIEGTCEGAASYTINVVVDGAAGGSANCAGAPYQSVIGPLNDGTHSVTVYALDAGGSPTGQSDALTITIDTQTSVTITSGPSDPSTSPNAMFEIDAEAGDTLTCAVDAASPVACTSPVSYGNLGGGAHTFVVDASDVAGNHEQQTWNWTITAPAAPSTPVLDAASDSGSSNGDGVTSATAPVFNGTCEQDGDSVRLMDGATPIGSAAACASGVFSATATGIVEGSHAISAIANRGGIDSAQSGSATVVIDRTAPNAPVVTSPTPPVTPPFTMAGTAEANAAIAIALDASTVCSTNADAGGNWSCAIDATGSHLVFAVTATDLAGNVSAATTWTDDVAPNAPGMPALDAASDSGASNSDGITNAQTLSFHGTCDQDGDSIQMLDGATPAGSATTCASGAYAAAIAGLGEGSHSISARASRGGIDSAPSAAVTIVVDRTAPASPVVTGPPPPVPADFTLTGTAEAASEIAVTESASLLCATTTDGSGDWSCAISTDHVDTLSLAITATDVAGNTSAATTWNTEGDMIFRNGFEN